MENEFNDAQFAMEEVRTHAIRQLRVVARSSSTVACVANTGAGAAHRARCARRGARGGGVSSRAISCCARILAEFDRLLEMIGRWSGSRWSRSRRRRSSRSFSLSFSLTFLSLISHFSLKFLTHCSHFLTHFSRFLTHFSHFSTGARSLAVCFSSGFLRVSIEKAPRICPCLAQFQQKDPVKS